MVLSDCLLIIYKKPHPTLLNEINIYVCATFKSVISYNLNHGWPIYHSDY